jgi:hypothetical protein
MKVATGSIFAAAIIGSTVGLKGSTPPSDPAAPASQAQQPVHQTALPAEGARPN